MRALLLAGGLGTRLRPLTDTLPKCLVPIRGIPLLDYWLDLLLTGGVERILINTHYRAEQVRAHLAASPWRERVEITHEEDLLGTGGTLLANRHFFGDAPFLVAHADNLTRFDVQAFIRRHTERPPRCMMTMMTFETDNPRACGIVELDEKGVVEAFHEKVANPPGTRANGAVYIFEPALFGWLQGLGKPVIDLSTEVLPAFLGRIATFHNTDYLRDIGTMESLAQAEQDYRFR